MHTLTIVLVYIYIVCPCAVDRAIPIRLSINKQCYLRTSSFLLFTGGRDLKGTKNNPKVRKKQWVSREKNSALIIISTTNQAISIKFATTVGHFVRDLNFENVSMP